MTVLKYPGSKNQIAGSIIRMFPDAYRRMTYLEPFFGSGAVFFQKAPSVIETLNDLNNGIYNFFFQIREWPEELARLIEYTPWSRLEYEQSYEKTEDGLENARRLLVNYWFCIGYRCGMKNGWRHNIKGDSGGIGGYQKLPEIIKQAAARLKPKPGNIVQIENKDAFELIEHTTERTC
jgi:DNA adenine methylase